MDVLLTSDPMGSPVSSKTVSTWDKEDKVLLAAVGGPEGPEKLPAPCRSQTDSPPVGLIKGDDKAEGPVTEQVVYFEPQCQGVQSNKVSAVCEQICQYSNFTRAPYSFNTFCTSAVHLIYTSDPHATSCTAPGLQINTQMLTLGSHPQAIISSSTSQYPFAEQPTPQALYVTVYQFYPHHATQHHGHKLHPATTTSGSQPQSQQVPSPPPLPWGPLPFILWLLTSPVLCRQVQPWLT